MMPNYRVTLIAPDGFERSANLNFPQADINWFDVRVRDLTTERQGQRVIALFPYPRDGFATKTFATHTFGG
jgi:hypothetical protein